MKAIEDKKNPLTNLIVSGIFSAAAGILIVLVLWRFELRSIARFFILAAPVAAVFWAGSYFLYFRNSGLSLDLPLPIIRLNTAASILLCSTWCRRRPP